MHALNVLKVLFHNLFMGFLKVKASNRQKVNQGVLTNPDIDTLNNFKIKKLTGFKLLQRSTGFL